MADPSNYLKNHQNHHQESGLTSTSTSQAPVYNVVVSDDKSVENGFCDQLEAQLSHLGKGSTWLGIFIGQVLSGILCLSAITTVYLVDFYDIHVPNAQNFAFYLLLTCVYTSRLACRKGEKNLFPVLRSRGMKYMLVALADVEGSYLVVRAYKYTTLTSVQLLDCFTIPTVLSLSWLILRIRYRVTHIVGVSICLLGVCCLVWADIEEGRSIGPGKDRFKGDMHVLAGAFLYGISNVSQEFCVKTFDIVEFLGVLGLYGSFFSGIQTFVLEYDQVISADWFYTPLVFLGGFAISQFAFYSLSAVVMKLSSATAFNLSILSADFYSIIVGIVLFQYKFHALYFLSFILVMSGVIVFSIKPTLIDSNIYRSMTREVTTTVDLELLGASTPMQGETCLLESSTFGGGGFNNLTNGHCDVDVVTHTYQFQHPDQRQQQQHQQQQQLRMNNVPNGRKQVYEPPVSCMIPEEEIC